MKQSIQISNIGHIMKQNKTTFNENYIVENWKLAVVYQSLS